MSVITNPSIDKTGMVLSESAFAGKIILQQDRTFFGQISYSVSNDEVDVTKILLRR